MSRLLACPFCRELYAADETTRCTHCDVDLAPMEKLPPSIDVLAEEAADGELVPPQDRVLPWTYLRRGRGALVALAVAGLAAFFSPWVDMDMPHDMMISGFDLARGRAGWLWGGAVGWFVLLPLVITRRTIARMRGVRIVTALLAGMTLGEVIMMVSLPPQGHRLLPVEYSWAWGLYVSGIASALGVLFGARFGGRVDDLPATPWEDASGNVHVERSDGEVLH